MSVQPGAWSSSIGSHNNLRKIVSVAVIFSCIRAMMLAAVAMESVAVTDSDTDGFAVSLLEVVSAMDAASLIAAGNVVFEDSVSVLVLLSAMKVKKINMEDVASVAVAVSAMLGVNVAPDWVWSAAEAVSAMFTA